MTFGYRLAALLFYGPALVLLYEGTALWFGLPTISRITSDQIQVHPNGAVVIAFLLGMLAFALLNHFAGTLPWWRP